MFCNKCGGKIDNNKNINNLCPKPDCDKYVFLNPKIAVLAVVQKDNEILLVKAHKVKKIDMKIKYFISLLFLIKKRFFLYFF